MAEVLFVTVAPTDGGQSVPAWMRTAGIDAISGECYVPAALFGAESDMYLRATWSGANGFLQEGRFFISVEFLKVEMPDYAAALDKLQANILRLMAENPPPATH